MSAKRILSRIILATGLVAATLPMALPSRAQAVNTCTIAVPAGTAVTMGDGNQVIPFTVTNTGNDRSIDTVQLEFDAGIYDLSLGIAPPANWSIQSKQAGGGQTWVRYASNGPAYNIAPGASLTFDVPLIGLSNGQFPSALTDVTDALQSARTYVQGGGTTFSCGTLPTWPRRGLAVSVTAYPLSLAVGQTLVVNMMVTNRSSVMQNNITTTLTDVGSGGVTLAGGPVPVGLDLASGASTSLVYTYTASANGMVIFTGNAANDSVTSKPAQSDTVYIGTWTASVELNATQVVSGQLVIVRMTVQNNAAPSVGNVTPTLMATGAATATLVSGPTPNKINSIPAGGSGTFEWTYRITGPVGATFAFSGYATDRDGQTTNTSTSSIGIISKYAVTPDPPQVPAGSTNFTIAFTVYNNGSTPLDQVVFSIPLTGWEVNQASSSGGYNGTWNGNYSSGQHTFTFSSRNSSQDLPVGASATFSIYFDFGPSPASDTWYDFGTALYRNNVLQGGATPMVLVTKFRLVLTANPAFGIPADGASTSTITATVTQGGTPQAGVTVQFESTAGTLSGATAATNAAGQAVVRLTAPISTQAITATVTSRYLTNYDTVDVGFTGFVSPNPLYVGGTLNPMGGQPGDAIAISLGVINLGTQPITLTTASVFSFTDGTRVYTSTLTAPTFIPTDTTRAVTITVATINSAFTPGAYYPVLQLVGTNGQTYNRPVSDPFWVGIAALRVSLSATPSVVGVSQLITVTMVVTNVGVNTANVITPSVLTLGGTGSATFVSGPSPASAPTLTAGGVTTFTWTFSAAGLGVLNWTGRAYSTDANTGQPIASPVATSNNVLVQPLAALVASLDAIPTTVSLGQSIAVTMRVTNTSEATATGVMPSLLTLGGTGSAGLVSGPSPASVGVLAGGAVVTFTWVYAGASSGTVNWSGSDLGLDAGSGLTVTSPLIMSNNVLIQSPAALVSALSATPGVVAVGQSIAVTMTVTNTGQAIANVVAPSALTMSGSGSATLLSSPSPASTTIPGGSTATFTWIYSAASSGTVIWTGHATGSDANSGALISSPDSASNTVTISTPAALISVLTAAPDTVNISQTIAVTMTVTNIGQSDALNVTPSALIVGGTGGVSFVSGPSPASATILAGGMWTFVWSYQATISGTVNWRGNASGTDAVFGNGVSSAFSTSNDVVIQAILTYADYEITSSGGGVTIVARVRDCRSRGGGVSILSWEFR